MGSCEHSNEHLRSIRFKEFLDHLTGSWHSVEVTEKSRYLQDSQCPADIRTLDFLNRDKSIAALIYLFQEVI